MAPRLRHWVAAAAVGCAAIGVAKLPPEPFVPVSSFSRSALPEEQAVGRLGGKLRRMNDNLVLLELRDSLMAVLAQLPTRRDDAPVILVEPNLPPTVRTLITRLGEPAWRNTAPHVSAIELVIAVAVDTVHRPRDLPRGNRDPVRLAHLLPQVTDGRTCLAIVSLGTRVAERAALGQPITPTTLLGRNGIPGRPAALLGSCGFLAAFGQPGAQIEQWLESGDYLLSSHPEWRAPPPLTEQRSGRWSWFGGWMNPELGACAAGDAERCRTAALPPPRKEDRFSWPGSRLRPSTLAGVAGSSGRGRWVRHPLGLRARNYLADMVADLGTDRFARFWSSSLPVDSAFAAATGESIGEWTMRWARAQISTPETGPSMSLSSTLMSLLVAGTFVGGAAMLVRRRQVS